MTTLVSSEPRPSRIHWIAVGLALLVAAALGVRLYHSQSELEAARQRLAELEAKDKPATPEKLAPALKSEEQKPVLENLKPLLKVENEEVRARAVELTALVAPKESDLLLDQVLRADPSPRVKLTALDVIGKQKVEYCRSEMLELLKSDDGAVRRKAAWALGALGKSTDSEGLQRTRSELLEALKQETSLWMASLTPKPVGTKADAKKSEAVSGQAFGMLGVYIQALAELGDAETARALSGLLENMDPLVRRETVLALGKIGAPDSKNALVARYKSDPEIMVQEAIVAVLTAPAFKMKFNAKSRQFADAP